MKKLGLFICLIISLTGYSQKLNRLGKIVLDELPQAPEYWRIRDGKNYRIIYNDTLNFEGNEFYKLPNAFIANHETADNDPDKINYYNAKGKLIVSIYTPRIINFKVSVKGNYAAFFNQQKLLLVNLNNFHIDTLFGSYSFSFTNDEQLIYFDSEERIIVYDNNTFSIDEYPSQFIDFNGNILAIALKNIYKFSGSDFVSIYNFTGTFFDAMIIGNDLYFVEKIIKRGDISYTLYKTSDLHNFEVFEKSDYK